MEKDSYMEFLEEAAAGALSAEHPTYYKSDVDEIIEWDNEKKPLPHSKSSSELNSIVQKILSGKDSKVNEDSEIKDEFENITELDINLNEDEEVILDKLLSEIESLDELDEDILNEDEFLEQSDDIEDEVDENLLEGIDLRNSSKESILENFEDDEDEEEDEDEDEEDFEDEDEEDEDFDYLEDEDEEDEDF